jgi:hypothetical protein
MSFIYEEIKKSGLEEDFSKYNFGKEEEKVIIAKEIEKKMEMIKRKFGIEGVLVFGDTIAIFAPAREEFSTKYSLKYSFEKEAESLLDRRVDKYRTKYKVEDLSTNAYHLQSGEPYKLEVNIGNIFPLITLEPRNFSFSIHIFKLPYGAEMLDDLVNLFYNLPKEKLKGSSQ